MKAHQSKWILAIAIFLLLLTARENLAQEVGAPPASDDSNSGEAKENYIIPALEIVGFDFALNRFNQRYIDRESFNVSWSSVRRNLKSKWVVDNDEFATNQFLHPYQGSIYHTAARSAGLNYWTSTVYTFAGSALWEIAGETTRPSRNDQIASGSGGHSLVSLSFEWQTSLWREATAYPASGEHWEPRRSRRQRASIDSFSASASIQSFPAMIQRFSRNGISEQPWWSTEWKTHRSLQATKGSRNFRCLTVCLESLATNISARSITSTFSSLPRLRISLKAS